VIGGGSASGGGSSASGSSAKGADAGGSFDNAITTSPGLVGTSQVGTYTTPDGNACLDPDTPDCITPQKTCGADATTSDVLVDPHGKVLSTICYPTTGYHVQQIGDAPVSMLPPVENNSVVVLDGKDDGVDIEGDVTLQGNNVILIGQGPDVSVIGGDLNIDKNNAIVRGVRIKGSTTITKNNAALIDCVIEGDLTITMNNVSLALCEVWGKLMIEGNNEYLVSNLIAGDQMISGKNLECNDNHYFTDSNGDHVVDKSEVLAPVTCGSDATAGGPPGGNPGGMPTMPGNGKK
jgi:hypothetical protein